MKKFKLDSFVFLVIIFLFVIVLHQDITRADNLDRENKKINNAATIETEKLKALSIRDKKLAGNDMVEVIARQRLGLVKAGETAYKIVYNDR